MNSVLLKSLVGVGVLGTTTAASVGGYYWLSSPTPKTIRERLREKTPLEFYSATDSDSSAKGAWTTKVNSYKASGAQNVDTSILSTDSLDEATFSNKCKTILDTLWDKETEELKKKETWASHWCFNQT